MADSMFHIGKFLRSGKQFLFPVINDAQIAKGYQICDKR